MMGGHASPPYPLDGGTCAKARLAKARLAKARLVPSRCVPSIPHPSSEPGNYVPSIAPRTPPPNLSLHATDLSGKYNMHDYYNHPPL